MSDASGQKLNTNAEEITANQINTCEFILKSHNHM